MGNQNRSCTDLVGDLEFTDFTAGFGYDPDR